MAHLEVKRKKPTSWWIWLLLILVLLVLLIMWIRGDNPYPSTDKMSTDTSGNLASDQTEAIAITEPDWDRIDFNAPEIKAPEINVQIMVFQGAHRYNKVI